MPVGRKMKPKFRERNRKRKDRARERNNRYFYNGVMLASKMEVAWAVFFDQMNIVWKYEPTMVLMSNGKVYPPDFYLPQYGIYVEIKGNEGGSLGDTALEMKMEELVEKTGRPVLLAQGSPHRAILYLGTQAGLTFFLPSPIGVLVSENVNTARCRECKQLVFFRAPPNRFTAAGCSCGKWPAELEVLPAEEIKKAIRNGIDWDDVTVY